MIKAEDNIMLESQKPIYDIAADTDQYFWHTSTGTDTGAHITEIPQEDFLEDPANGGYNLLARSNGLAVRDGLTELARFTANGVQIGADNKAHSVYTATALDFYDTSNNKVMSLANSAINLYRDGEFKCSIGDNSGFYGIRVGGDKRTSIKGDNEFECAGYLYESDHGYTTIVRIRAEGGGQFALEKNYSEAYLNLASSAANGLRYNYIAIDANTAGWSGIEASTTITVNSDERLKKDFEPVGRISDLIYDIEPVVYSWNDGRTDLRHIGFKAQGVKTALDKVVKDSNAFNIVSKGNSDYYNLSYTELIPLIIDQLQKQNERLNKIGA